MKNNIYKFFVIFISCCLLFIDCVSAIENYQVVNQGGKTESDDVVVSKTIEETDHENYFDITLNVSTTSNIETLVKDRDLSIVIVMDISNTMVTTNIDGTLHESYPNKNTRYDAAMSAGENFINTFLDYSINVDAKRQIGYVAFNSDATKIFDLQDCKTQSSAANLINTMKSKTNNIINSQGYSSSKKRFTNIEAGLKMAHDMLLDSSSENKYIIILSDGFPTTYIESGYTGYINYTPLSTSSTVGNFYNTDKSLPCEFGVSYSDRAAERAQEEATKIKKSGIVVFSIGAGLNGQPTINELMKDDTKTFSVVDSYEKSANRKIYGYDYVIGNNISDFKNWLKNKIGSGYYYDTTDTDNLIQAYKQIFNSIQNISQSKIEAMWVVKDTINELQEKYIEFLGFYNKSNELVSNLIGSYGNNKENSAKYINDELLWDLKNSGYTITETGNKKIYNYTIKYRVRLKNENKSFDKNNIYKTNGDTFLTYRVNENNSLSDEKTLYFKVPEVIGFLSDLSFVKVSNIDKVKLSGVEFKLTHDKSKCKYNTNVEIADMYAMSDENGVVNFKNIPSGHNYILTEVNTLQDYIKSNTVYNINVSYGKITITPNLNTNDNNIFYIENQIRSGSIVVNKTVVSGNKDKNFQFVLTLDNKKINGTYGDMIFEDGIAQFVLKDGDSKSAVGIPIGTKYAVEEINGDEYVVTSSNSEGKIKENEIIEVNFTNIKKPNNEGDIVVPNTNDSILYNFVIALVMFLGLIASITIYIKKCIKNN